MGTIIMNTQLAKIKRITIFLAGIFTASIPAVAHADWSIKGLGFLGEHASSYRYSSANDINDSGQVVGDSSTRIGSSSFITGPNGVGMTDLGTNSTFDRIGINNSGQVAGTFHYHAFITGPNGIGITDLGTFGGTQSAATGINDSGQVVGGVGSVIAGDWVERGFITGPNGIGMTDLGANYTYPTGINDSGQVAGSSYSNASGSNHAFITGANGVGMTDLGTLGGNESSATGINNSGQVVGYSFIAGDNYYHAFITSPNGVGMTDLGTLGGNFSEAYSINNSGDVVGVSEVSFINWHSFIFSHGGITDLSLLAPVVADGWTDLVVRSINNNGQMVGFGQHHGNKEAFLLSYTPETVFDPKPIYIPPVPEPETYLMLLGGLGLIGYLARRRKETVI